MRLAAAVRACALAALLLGVGLGAPARAEERFALLVGASAGWADDVPLRYAEEEAELLREVLLELGGFSEDRVELLRDPDTATVRARLRSLAERLRGLGGPSLVFLYFAGHADARGLHLRGAALSRWELQQALGALPATVRLGVLNLCGPGAARAAPGAGPGPGPQVSSEWRPEGLGLLTLQGEGRACGGEQGLTGTRFLHHLVSGLRGAGGAQRVRLSEAAEHAWRQQGGEQGSALALSGGGEAEPSLTQPGQGEAWLVVPGGGGPHMVVDALAVRRVAQAEAEAGRPVALALAAGRYQVLRWRGLQLERAALALAPGARVEAEALAYEATAAGCLPRCGAQGLEGEALRRWRRGEALRLLAAGQATAALSLFESLLAEQPGEESLLRGKARALLRVAEAAARGRREQPEYEALRAAVEAEPSLAEDPDFPQRLRRLQVLQAAAERASRSQELSAERAARAAPRRGYRWGLGLEVFGSRGLWAPMALWAPWEWLQVHGALDLLGGQAVDVGARLMLGKDTAGFFIGVGGRLQPLGQPVRALDLLELSEQERYAYGPGVHLDVGMQLFSEGLSLELGLSAQWSSEGRTFLRYPTLTIGRLFP